MTCPPRTYGAACAGTGPSSSGCSPHSRTAVPQGRRHGQRDRAAPMPARSRRPGPGTGARRVAAGGASVAAAGWCCSLLLSLSPLLSAAANLHIPSSGAARRERLTGPEPARRILAGFGGLTTPSKRIRTARVARGITTQRENGYAVAGPQGCGRQGHLLAGPLAGRVDRPVLGSGQRTRSGSAGRQAAKAVHLRRRATQLNRAAHGRCGNGRRNGAGRGKARPAGYLDRLMAPLRVVAACFDGDGCGGPGMSLIKHRRGERGGCASG
jgi:hypothetical protein